MRMTPLIVSAIAATPASVSLVFPFAQGTSSPRAKRAAWRSEYAVRRPSVSLVRPLDQTLSLPDLKPFFNVLLLLMPARASLSSVSFVFPLDHTSILPDLYPSLSVCLLFCFDSLDMTDAQWPRMKPAKPYVHPCHVVSCLQPHLHRGCFPSWWCLTQSRSVSVSGCLFLMWLLTACALLDSNPQTGHVRCFLGDLVGFVAVLLCPLKNVSNPPCAQPSHLSFSPHPHPHRGCVPSCMCLMQASSSVIPCWPLMCRAMTLELAFVNGQIGQRLNSSGAFSVVADVPCPLK